MPGHPKAVFQRARKRLGGGAPGVGPDYVRARGRARCVGRHPRGLSGENELPCAEGDEHDGGEDNDQLDRGLTALAMGGRRVAG